MESRDLGGGGSKEGSVEEEGKGGVLSVTAALAKDAALLFQSRRFLECANVLYQLLQKKENDPKVLHNIAIVEYIRDGRSDPKKLLDMLNKVKKRSEELVHASGIQVESRTKLGSNLVVGSQGSGTFLHQFSAANTACIAYADEFDTSIMRLNMAVILYHLHDYASALSLLESLFQNIEPIDETTALHVCLLFLDIALASGDASRAALVIQYLERAFGVEHILSQEDNAVASYHSSSNQAVKVSASSTGVVAPDSSDPSDIIAPETPLGGALSDAIEYENLLSTWDSSGDNLKRQSSNEIPRTTDMIVAAVDLKLKLQLYKVRFLLLTRNLKATKREMKLAMNNSRGKDSSMALLLKAQLEYARGNHRKAIKLLGNRTEAELSSMLNNNLGCIFHQLKKYHSSIMLFAKALKSSSSVLAKKPLALDTFSQDKSLFTVYNCGLGNLFCGQPLVAAHCFHKATVVFDKQPLLWLRFAECCLVAQEKGLLKSNGSSLHTEEARVHLIGSGKWRHLNFETNSSIRTFDTKAEDGLIVNKDGEYRLSIPFAQKCLLNALYLLDVLELKSIKGDLLTGKGEDKINEKTEETSIKNLNHKSSSNDSKTSNATTAYTPIANIDSQEISGKLASSSNLSSTLHYYENMLVGENHIIKQAVLANLAYVELCLENPLKALSAAKALLQLADCSKTYAFLGRVYAAEALCHLNRPREAAEFLLIYLSSDSTIELPYSDEHMENLKLGKGEDGEELSGSATTKTTCSEPLHAEQFLKPEDACGLLYVNLSSLSAMQGNLDQAFRFVTAAVSIIPHNPRALLQAIYLDLLMSKTEDAIIKLKSCNSIRFLPKTAKLSK